eukprot:8879955-Pyramimonas_sp.AAC.1
MRNVKGGGRPRTDDDEPPARPQRTPFLSCRPRSAGSSSRTAAETQRHFQRTVQCAQTKLSYN